MKKLFSGLLAVSIGLVAIALSAALCAIAPPNLQPVQAQTQNSQQQELEKLQKQAEQLTQQEKYTEAIAPRATFLTNFMPDISLGTKSDRTKGSFS